MSGKSEKAFRREVQRQIDAHREKRDNTPPGDSLNIDPGRLHPLGDQVLFAIEIEEETSGGIIIPQSAQTAQANGLPVGRVLAVGESVTRFRVGELIMAAGRDTAGIGGTQLRFVPEAKILCRVDPKPVRLIDSPH